MAWQDKQTLEEDYLTELMVLAVAPTVKQVQLYYVHEQL